MEHRARPPIFLTFPVFRPVHPCRSQSPHLHKGTPIPCYPFKPLRLPRRYSVLKMIYLWERNQYTIPSAPFAILTLHLVRTVFFDYVYSSQYSVIGYAIRMFPRSSCHFLIEYRGVYYLFLIKPFILRIKNRYPPRRDTAPNLVWSDRMCKNGIGCYHRAFAYHYSFCTCQDFSTSSNHCPLADNNSTKMPTRIFSTQSNIVIDSYPIFNRYQWVHYRAVTIMYQSNVLTEFYALWDINSKALHDNLTKKTNHWKFPQLKRTPKCPPPLNSCISYV